MYVRYDAQCLYSNYNHRYHLGGHGDARSAAVPGERDVLIMRHDVGVEWPNHSEEMIHVNFVIYGDPNKYSAMAATVGYPTAIATKMVLEGRHVCTAAMKSIG